MRLQSSHDLIAKLHSKKYRDAFVSSRVSNTLALQIRAMRQERGWSQAHLAKLLGTSQNAVYRLESPQYGKYSITTLKRLASIFDVGLAVWLVPFSKLIDRVTHLSTEDIIVPSFDDDPGLREDAPVLAANNLSYIDKEQSLRAMNRLVFSLGKYVPTSKSEEEPITLRGDFTMGLQSHRLLKADAIKIEGEIVYGRTA
jgi:transcriptional regulator with XRE-family HTH domain